MSGDLRRSVLLVISAGLLMVGALAQGADYLSPEVVLPSKDGKTLFVAEATARQVAIVDIASKKVVASVRLPENPTGLALSNDGAVLIATAGVAPGKVYKINVKDRKVIGSFAAGHSPVSPCFSTDGKLLYVCSRHDNAVLFLDAAGGKEVARVGVMRDAIDSALTPDGKTLFVVNHLPSGATDGAYAASAVSVIDTASRKVVKTIKLPNGSMSVKAICLSPDGKFAYLTHQVGRYHLPTTQLERGWMNTNAMTILDVLKQAYVNTVLLDDVDHGAANPWGVTCSPDGKYVCVTLAGTHELTVIDRAALHGKLDRLAKGEKVSDVSKTPEDVVNDLAFLYELRRRLKLPGNGPRSVAVVGNMAYVTEYFTDSLAAIDVTPDKYPRPTSVALGPKLPLTPARLGERHFHNAALCFQQWQSCVSCHPDTRADGLNWDLLNDGMGNPKNTKSMLLAHQTPPAMITGVRDKAETAVRSGIRYIQFAVRPEEDAVAIDAYCKALKPTASPHLVNGKLSEAAKRGKKVFDKAQCVVCHPGPLFTDLEMHNVGTGAGRETDREYDTPTLVECWRTAPYLYDGRAATMKDVLTAHNKKDQHGVTSKLGEKELADLAEYVLSL